jgi:hypothetical protein
VFPWYIVATAGVTLLAQAFLPAAEKSVSRVVSRVDVRRLDAEQLGHLLDQDRQHHGLEVGAGLAAVLDGTSEEHQPRRLTAAAAQ